MTQPALDEKDSLDGLYDVSISKIDGSSTIVI